MTLILRIKGKINNPDAPKLIKYDPIEHRTGSLFLWDAGLQNFSSVPIVGSTIPNLLDEYSGGSGNALTLEKGTFGNAVHDAYIKRELTAKKAMHFIVAQNYSGDTYATINNALSANAALQAKLFSKISNNPNLSNLYISIWEKVTRVAPSGANAPELAYISSTSSLSDHVFVKQVNNFSPIVSSQSISQNFLNKLNSDVSVLGQKNRNLMNIKGVVGAGVLSGTKAMFALFGSTAPWAGASYLNKSASRIIYRIYIEDLNLSGRTFEQVKMIDDAEFEKAFAVGGRFYNDTWSDPATVLP